MPRRSWRRWLCGGHYAQASYSCDNQLGTSQDQPPSSAHTLMILTPTHPPERLRPHQYRPRVLPCISLFFERGDTGGPWISPGSGSNAVTRMCTNGRPSSLGTVTVYKAQGQIESQLLALRASQGLSQVSCSRATSLNGPTPLRDFGSRQITNWRSEELIDELSRLVEAKRTIDDVRRKTRGRGDDARLPLC